MTVDLCQQCAATRIQYEAARARICALESEVEQQRDLLRESGKLIELQKADLQRYREAYEKAQPNRPERAPPDDLQLAFGRVLEGIQPPPPAAPSAEPETEGAAEPNPDLTPPKGRPKCKKNRHLHGRRRLDLTKLPVEKVEIDPEEVVAAGRQGFVRIGEERSERIAYRPGGYVRLCFIRGKWTRKEDVAKDVASTRGLGAEDTAEGNEAGEVASSPIIVAPLPESVWPKGMGDASAVADVVISKYDDSLPLNRQEHISARHGFRVPRSTQCAWLGTAYSFCYRIVDAMLVEACANAFCIATDATGAPVRNPIKRKEERAVGELGKCESWHIFVLCADRDHVIFRATPEHSGAAVRAMLKGFRGHLLADAAGIYDVLYRDHGVTEVSCWFHFRRYFWRAIGSDRERAFEALSLIAKLFEIDRECKEIPMPDRTWRRAARARPILDILDRWIAKQRSTADPRGPLAAAITYYDNQREGLRRFLDDGRLRLDNNISEGELRKVVLGRGNWMFFENETGLAWYTTFRSLISSCALHGLNPQLYIEQLLRLAPYWPVNRVIELAPKYWAATLENLDARQQAIITRPWEPVPNASPSLSAA